MNRHGPACPGHPAQRLSADWRDGDKTGSGDRGAKGDVAIR
jgi:hypothetical protein